MKKLCHETWLKPREQEIDQFDETSWVSLWEEELLIPTYPPPEPERNPMFLEHRVFQGSKGNVYPLPFTDTLSCECTDKAWQTVFMENKYIKLLILPEIDGRIHVALDKTNNYDFIYRNNVIKSTLAGLCEPWICGGIEFYWPQHHHPTTFMPLDYVIQENSDGRKNTWVGEIEPMY